MEAGGGNVMSNSCWNTWHTRHSGSDCNQAIVLPNFSDPDQELIQFGRIFLFKMHLLVFLPVHFTLNVFSLNLWHPGRLILLFPTSYLT